MQARSSAAHVGTKRSSKFVVDSFANQIPFRKSPQAHTLRRIQLEEGAESFQDPPTFAPTDAPTNTPGGGSEGEIFIPDPTTAPTFVSVCLSYVPM
jgi:hypothetical protein